jgi:hypothetical protein
VKLATTEDTEDGKVILVSSSVSTVSTVVERLER